MKLFVVACLFILVVMMYAPPKFWWFATLLLTDSRPETFVVVTPKNPNLPDNQQVVIHYEIHRINLD